MKHTKRTLASVLVASALVSLSATSALAKVTDKDIENDAATPGDVVSWGIGTRGQRYSTSTEINTKTVKNLVPAWSFSFGGEKQRGQESQPVVSNGKMFVTGSYSRVFALDAKTGQKLWQYEHRLPDGIMPCCDVINRGGALYDNLFIFATLDAQLVALDQDSGKVIWKEKLGDYAAGYSATAAPIIAKGLVLTGVSGGEFGIVGRVDARDAKTGKLVWTRPTVEGHMGYKYVDGKPVENGISGTTNATWPGELWKTGGAATWLGGTYDPDTGLAYFGAGNPAPWNSHLRPGDNLFSCATVAIDIATGKIVWHFQGTPNDGWDFDGVNEFITYKTKDGKILGGKADRNGFFYVLDAKTGKFQNGFPFVKKQTWAKGLTADGKPIFIPEGRPGDPTASADGKKGSSVFSAPSFLGGKNQMPMAYSPDTGYFYVPANEWGMERADHLQEGRGLPRRRVHHQDPGSQGNRWRLHRRPACGRSQDRQDRLGSSEQGSAVGRRADDQGRPGVLGHPGRLPEGGRRQDRQGVVAVQRRHRYRCASDRLGTERRAVHRGRRRLGWRGSAVGRRGGEEGQHAEPGRFDVGLQAAQALSSNAHRPGVSPGRQRKSRLHAGFFVAMGCAMATVAVSPTPTFCDRGYHFPASAASLMASTGITMRTSSPMPGTP